MSVLLEFAMFPTDKGESVSPYVARIVSRIAESHFAYQLTAMGTLVETETVDEALELVAACYKLLQPDCNRVYTTLTMDVRQDHQHCLEGKVASVRNQMSGR
ncbi:MAG: MTH1187 family thiamine-binding protein [Bacteroidales bacterium]|nr:MTH1187 family thiamine-binding protein [Bacteroidales bacterium]